MIEIRKEGLNISLYPSIKKKSHNTLSLISGHSFISYQPYFPFSSEISPYTKMRGRGLSLCILSRPLTCWTPSLRAGPPPALRWSSPSSAEPACTSVAKVYFPYQAQLSSQLWKILRLCSIDVRLKNTLANWLVTSEYFPIYWEYIKLPVGLPLMTF